MLPLPSSVVERVGGAALVVGVGGVVWPTVTDATGLTIPCPLRAATGVPCPLCGMTTATVALVRGRFADAVAANPLVVVLAVLAVAAVALATRRAAVLATRRTLRPNAQTTSGSSTAGPPLASRWSSATVAVVVVAAWLWQVHRIGLAG